MQFTISLQRKRENAADGNTLVVLIGGLGYLELNQDRHPDAYKITGRDSWWKFVKDPYHSRKKELVVYITTYMMHFKLGIRYSYAILYSHRQRWISAGISPVQELRERDAPSHELMASFMISVTKSEHVVFIISVHSCKICTFMLDFTVEVNSRHI